jgi:hypothetical protein
VAAEAASTWSTSGITIVKKTQRSPQHGPFHQQGNCVKFHKNDVLIFQVGSGKWHPCEPRFKDVHKTRFEAKQKGLRGTPTLCNGSSSGSLCVTQILKPNGSTRALTCGVDTRVRLGL